MMNEKQLEQLADEHLSAAVEGHARKCTVETVRDYLKLWPNAAKLRPGHVERLVVTTFNRVSEFYEHQLPHDAFAWLGRELTESAAQCAQQQAAITPSGEVGRWQRHLRDNGYVPIELDCLIATLDDGETIDIITQREVTTSRRTIDRFGLRTVGVPANCTDVERFNVKRGFPSRADIEAEDLAPRE